MVSGVNREAVHVGFFELSGKYENDIRFETYLLKKGVKNLDEKKE